jgi:hypothetical protein
MGDDNPFRTRAPSPPGERRRRPLGPVAVGVVAIVLATVLMKGTGLLASLLAVGSWWAFKFRPRPMAPDVPEARGFLQRVEESPPDRAAAAESDRPPPSEPAGDFLGDLRL